MTAERLDKKWSEKGLASYSTEAILGTLNHYGVDLDEAKFKALAAQHWPLMLAATLQSSWKGTGQFAKLVPEAIEELWRRFMPGLTQPFDLIERVIELFAALIPLTERGATPAPEVPAAVDAAFVTVEKLVAALPAPGERRDLFIGELVMGFDEDIQNFSLLIENLAAAQQTAAMDRLIAFENSLFPTRAEVSAALAQIASGKEEEGLIALQNLAENSQRQPSARLGAIEGLMRHGHAKRALTGLTLLVNMAEVSGDVHLFDELHDALHEILHELTDPADQKMILDAVERAHRVLEKHGHGHGHGH